MVLTAAAGLLVVLVSALRLGWSLVPKIWKLVIEIMQ
jgi:hypothetical protein